MCCLRGDGGYLKILMSTLGSRSPTIWQPGEANVTVRFSGSWSIPTRSLLQGTNTPVRKKRNEAVALVQAALSTLSCKHAVLGVPLQANHTINLDFRVMVRVTMADFLPGSPGGDTARTVTYSGSSRAALLPSRQY